MGATDIVSYKDGDVVQQILAINGGQVDRVIIAGGNCATMNQALSVVKPNGTISSVNFYDVKDIIFFADFLCLLFISRSNNKNCANKTKWQKPM